MDECSIDSPTVGGSRAASTEDFDINTADESQASGRRRSSFIRPLVLGGTLFVLWVILSGFFEPLFFIYGVVSCVVVVAIANRMDVIDHEGFPVQLSRRLIGYVPWLGKEIVKANLDVARIILDPRLPISPSMNRFRASQKTDLGRVIFANSITLTPGTITVGVLGDEFEVHAVTRAALDGTEEGEMDRRVSELEDAP